MSYSLTDGAAFAHKVKRSIDEIFAGTNLVYIKAYIDGKEVLTNSNFVVHLQQQIGDHDTFEIVCTATAFEAFGAYPFSESRRFLGKKITLEFKQFAQVAYLYTGVVTGLTNKKIGGNEGKMVLTGHSPTILLDNSVDCQSFENTMLANLVKTITQEYPSDLVKMVIKPENVLSLPYTVQYLESDFQFLKRLAKQYGQWFYYDGQQIVFGEHHVGLTELIERVDLISYELKMCLLPQKFTYISYDANLGEEYRVNSESFSRLDTNNPFQKYALGASEQLFLKNKVSMYNPNLLLRGKSQVNEALTRTKERNRNVFFVEGKSRNPNIQVGIIVRLKAYMPNNTVFSSGEVPLESYRVIELKHFHDGLDGYHNTFVGVPLDIKVPPYANEKAFPFMEDQSAKVVDNDDPEGVGRIRVQFYWQKPNQKSPWIRLIQPHAGGGKGFHFIPENGEEVMIGFESGNGEKPYVLGTHYNGATGSNYHTKGNDKKAIHTRSGTKIVLDDAEGSIHIEDPSGNIYLMDGAGNINVNAPNDITFNAGKNLNINVGNDMNTSVGNNHLVHINQIHHFYAQTYQQVIDGHKNVDVKGDLLQLTSTSTYKVIGGDYWVQSVGVSSIIGAVDAKINKG